MTASSRRRPTGRLDARRHSVGPGIRATAYGCRPCRRPTVATEEAMGSRIILGNRDLAALRGIVTFRDFTDPGPVLPWELLEHVRTLIGCAEVGLDRTRPSEQKLGEEQSIGDARHCDLLDQ